MFHLIQIAKQKITLSLFEFDDHRNRSVMINKTKKALKRFFLNYVMGNIVFPNFLSMVNQYVQASCY